MRLTEMFNICDTCVYAPCLCGHEPESCVAHVERSGCCEKKVLVKAGSPNEAASKAFWGMEADYGE